MTGMTDLHVLSPATPSPGGLPYSSCHVVLSWDFHLSLHCPGVTLAACSPLRPPSGLLQVQHPLLYVEHSFRLFLTCIALEIHVVS